MLLAGAACVLQGVGRANASAELPADAPFWMRAAQYLIGVALFADFAVLGTWVAFLGEGRHFSGGVPFLGAFNVSLARIMFGVGALICWLATIGYAVAGARKLLADSRQRTRPRSGRRRSAPRRLRKIDVGRRHVGRACGHSSAVRFALRVQSRH